MTTTNGGQSQGVQAKVMEAVSAFAQANERVVGELIDLSSTAARDGLRAIGELQVAAMETARGFQMPGMPQPETLEDLRRDPFVWYRKGVQALVDSAQRAAKLAEEQLHEVGEPAAVGVGAAALREWRQETRPAAGRPPATRCEASAR